MFEIPGDAEAVTYGAVWGTSGKLSSAASGEVTGT